MRSTLTTGPNFCDHLSLKIDNSQPVRLESFIRSLTSLASEFEKSVIDDPRFENSDAEIFIKEIRSGSIIADFIPYAVSVLPLVAAEIEKVGLAIDFVNKWKKRFTDLRQGIIPSGASKSDLKTWLGSVESIARDPHASSTLEAATFEDGKRDVKATFSFRTSDARQIESVIENELRRLEDRTHADFERVLMVFTRSDVGNAPVGKKSGERVVIGEVNDRPLAITYGSELAEQRIKHEIRDSDDNIYKKGFVVDVKLQKVGSRAVAYSILSVHDVIDLPDDTES